MTIDSRNAICRLFSIVLCCTAIASLSGCGGGPVPAPTSFKTFELKEAGWACEYPEGWDAKGGGKKNSSATFSKGSAKVSLATDITGSLMGDMASMGQKQGPAGPEDFPVHKVHMGDKDNVAKEYADYKEKEPEEFQNAIGGSSRKSEFTAAGGFSGPIHGYRATFLSRDRRFKVMCICSESDWKNLQPAFDKILESFHSAG